MGGFLSFESQVELKAKPTSAWSVPSVPIKVLDAPNLTEYGLSCVIDWSVAGTLVVGLADNVYTLPNAAAQSPGRVTQVPHPHGVNRPSAVQWSPNVSPPYI